MTWESCLWVFCWFCLCLRPAFLGPVPQFSLGSPLPRTQYSGETEFRTQVWGGDERTRQHILTRSFGQGSSGLPGLCRSTSPQNPSNFGQLEGGFCLLYLREHWLTPVYAPSWAPRGDPRVTKGPCPSGVSQSSRWLHRLN